MAARARPSCAERMGIYASWAAQIGNLSRGQAPPLPANLLLALHYAPGPTSAGPGTTEVSGNGYLKKPITMVVDPTGLLLVSTSEVLFDPATPNAWGPIPYASLVDGAAGGGVGWMYYGPLKIPKNVGANDQLRFKAGTIILEFR